MLSKIKSFFGILGDYQELKDNHNNHNSNICELSIQINQITYDISNMIYCYMDCDKIILQDGEYIGHYEIYRRRDSSINFVFINGRGMRKFPNGTIYDGYWQNSKPFGNGCLKLSNGDICNGEWNGYAIKDKCKILYKNKNKYSGQIKMIHDSSYKFKIVKHGFGQYDFNNGDYYEGFFDNNFMYGKGKYVSIQDELIYTSNYKNGKKNGEGIIIDKFDQSRKVLWKDDNIEYYL
jgi:hypothetical protein